MRQRRVAYPETSIAWTAAYVQDRVVPGAQSGVRLAYLAMPQLWYPRTTLVQDHWVEPIQQNSHEPHWTRGVQVTMN